jgi:hypothetical protein
MRYIYNIVILLFAGVPCALAQAGGAAAGSSDQSQLMEAVREVASAGSPGSLVLWAEP